MATLKRILVCLFFIVSLGLLMGQDGFCFFLTDNGDDLFSNTNVIGF